MATLTDAVRPSSSSSAASRRWDPDAWSCPDPERCVRCDCSVASPSTPGAGVVNFILDNQAVTDFIPHIQEDVDQCLVLGCGRPYQYQPLKQQCNTEEEDPEDEEELLLLLGDKTLLLSSSQDEDEDDARYDW
ncbi:hypothetical protein C0J52_13805 [Blattella germanica]|nr:hypothetical protein C0J52_13805 [Blattella germanica]